MFGSMVLIRLGPVGQGRMNSTMQQQNIETSRGAAARYWVVGGTYRSTQFDDPERQEERFGPFGSYAEAFAEWSRLAWKTVDDAHARYRIEKADEAH